MSAMGISPRDIIIACRLSVEVVRTFGLSREINGLSKQLNDLSKLLADIQVQLRLRPERPAGELESLTQSLSDLEDTFLKMTTFTKSQVRDRCVTCAIRTSNGCYNLRLGPHSLLEKVLGDLGVKGDLGSLRPCYLSENGAGGKHRNPGLDPYCNASTQPGLTQLGYVHWTCEHPGHEYDLGDASHYYTHMAAVLTGTGVASASYLNRMTYVNLLSDPLSTERLLPALLGTGLFFLLSTTALFHVRKLAGDPHQPYYLIIAFGFSLLIGQLLSRTFPVTLLAVTPACVVVGLTVSWIAQTFTRAIWRMLAIITLLLSARTILELQVEGGNPSDWYWSRCNHVSCSNVSSGKTTEDSLPGYKQHASTQYDQPPPAYQDDLADVKRSAPRVGG